ncbi:hypothetical protein LTR56_019487 [Elasticomyces elasticus]|nr:hypothetical protein LTR56_019487 [Elasticomyces elasticus]KAK3654325.1 hypothetical protein LTR22_010801 [Elasticomyces elasticus]KAK4920257.1 hypothetical protein LTR49_012208 [Elasticomyces elasticus]KAK5750789.1 hypothetical protein LTS12_019155 [Elasticomyces elasticus]
METSMIVERPPQAGTRSTATRDECYEKGSVNETEETFEDDLRSKMIALAGSEEPALWKGWSLKDSAELDDRVANVNTAEQEHTEMDTNQIQVEAQLATPSLGPFPFPWELMELEAGVYETDLVARGPLNNSNSPLPWSSTTPRRPPDYSPDTEYFLTHRRARPGAERERRRRLIPTPPTDPAHYEQLPPVPAEREPEGPTLEQEMKMFWWVWEKALAIAKAQNDEWVHRIIPTEQTEVQAKVEDVEAVTTDVEDEDRQWDVVMAQISQEVERRLRPALMD